MMHEFYQHLWLIQLELTNLGSISNAVTIYSALQAVEESYTGETLVHKKHRLM